MARLNDETVLKLRRLLCSWTVFYQKVHTYHWDLKGSEFLSFHKHLQTLYEESVQHADEIAERLRQLGVKISLNLSGASADSSVMDSNTAGTINEIAQDLITGIVQLTSLQTEVYNDADEQSDYVTVDLMTQLSKWCEFHSWFLTSILGEDNTTNM